NQDIEQAKGRRDHDTKVARNDRLGMIPDKRHPALGRHMYIPTGIKAPGHVLAHGAWRHPQPQLQQKLVGDALFAPHRVVLRHAADERLQVWRDRWASGPGCPPPEELKALPMPAEESSRLDHS